MRLMKLNQIARPALIVVLALVLIVACAPGTETDEPGAAEPTTEAGEPVEPTEEPVVEPTEEPEATAEPPEGAEVEPTPPMEAEETTTPEGEGAEPDSDLAGTRWNLVSLAGDEPLEQSNVTLDFDDGELGGNASCNHYGGPYTLEGDSFSVGELTQTLMACEGLMEQEERYLEMLQAAESLTLEGDTLTIQTAEGDLVYEPAQDVALEGTEWTLSGIVEDDAVVSTAVDTQITATFEDGVMAGSAGCNSYTVDYTVDGNTLTLGDAIRTEIACEDEEVMERENTFLAALENVSGYEIARDTLTLLDDEGNMVMTFTATAAG